MNNMSGSDLERKVIRALPGLFLESAELRLRQMPDQVPSQDAAVAIFELEIDDRRIPVHAEVKGRYSPAAEDQIRRWAAHRPEGIMLLVLPKIPRPVRARLREAGISHADLTGTIYLRAPGIKIDIAGTARPPRLSAEQRVNPFSKRASFVPRALLADPAAIVRVTALAERLDLAKSWVSQVLAELAERGWVAEAKREIRLVDPVGLLRAWALEYTWRDNEATRFTLPFEHDEILKRLPRSLDGLRWALTLQSGAAHLAPHVHYKGQLHFYVDPADFDAAVDRLKDHLHAEPAPSTGNVQLLGPYYGGATFYDLRQRGALPVVSPVQLFLDLAHFPVRGAEAATVIVRGVLAPELGLKTADARRLVQDLA
jgi:hypothetical protein